MYIKEICLEGFKSYATRTVISGFDPYFNAITGLNGSGKSNILDSICFVLGITNLQQVRAENLQQLVYKQGQSGISKATVSIIFDNLDRKRSPLGYEDCSDITVSRQVIGGERNKYLINGRVVQLKQVQNMFHYVQLNINNPHFIIMQGRITKVMNMKPPEILYMLEEAAGTRLYEIKKEDALKTIEKKQHKIDEINRLLDEEILPALEKMEKEKMQYMKWARGNEELERLRRFCIAYTFFQAEKTRDTALTGAEQTRIKIAEIYNDAKRMQGEIQDLQSKISKLTYEEDMTMAGEISSLLEKVDGLSSDFVKENTVLTNQQDSLRSEEEYAEKVVASIQDIEKSIQEINFYVLKAEEREADLKKRVEEHSKNLEELEKEYQGVLAGKSSGNEKKCLEDQLADAKAATGSALTQLEQLKTKMSHYDKELKEKKQQLLSKCEEAIAVEKELRIRRGDVEDTEIALKSVPYEEGQVEALQKDRMVEFEAMQRSRDEIRNLSSQLANVHFTYRDPVNRFDRLKVKGVVAKLINVKDGSRMTALEVAAGAKLFNIVVDTEKTATQLIQNGDLRSRVTIIPLNKIQPDTVTPMIQNAAVRLVGDGNAELALCLVTYDEEVEDAVKYVFGSTFVCTTIDFAKEVAFSKDIHTPSVTLEGDIFEPSGVLTGGCRKGGGELLRRLQMLSEFESKFSFHEKRLSEIDCQLSRLLPLQKKLMELKSELELQSYELELFQSRAQQSEHHKLGELVKKIEKDLEEAKLEEKEKELLYSNSLSVVHALQKSITEHANNRESRLVELEKKIKTTMNHMQLASEDLKGHANDRTRLIMEIEAVSQERASLEKHLSSLETQIHNIRAEVDKRSCKVNAIKKDNDRAQDELKLICWKMKARDSEINSLVKEEETLQHALSNSIIERKMLENELKCLEIKQKDCSLTVVKLLQKHSWIASEKNLFGRSGSDYDFSTCNPHRASEELEILQSEQSILEKRVNKKVIAMLEKAQDECNGLMSRKRIIESDKLKIETVIKELDEKKNKTLEITFLKVNKEFGSIFSTLLPGTMAKLEPPEGRNFLNGLEVHVAFGSVWKQSLSELSGGQRSLLTLSLILALLLFKPAPLYILDEVDSALDMSHTQNVGQMIKHHFPYSQFIVVSHKEGMFNNANVLFRTQFLDGVSTVTRTVTSKPSS